MLLSKSISAAITDSCGNSPLTKTQGNNLGFGVMGSTDSTDFTLLTILHMQMQLI